MYTINVYESSREVPSMYKVGNKGERKEDNSTRKEEKRKEVGGSLFIYI